MSATPGASPRPISGHHFSSLLYCPERAWLDLFGNPRDKAPDPGYLVGLQREGLKHEREASERMFPDAVMIPDQASPEQRARLTREAMAGGAPAILQGYLQGPGAIGIADVLEHAAVDPESPTGHRYRVGEFKRAETLKTAHVFQLCWYDDLLRRLQGSSTGDAFVVLGTGERRDLDLAAGREAYAAALARLEALREGAPRPGPHLCRDCPGCPWRAVCLPALVDVEHLSLVPGISRERAAALATQGIRTWRDLALRLADGADGLGIEPEEAARYSRAIAALAEGLPVLREPLRAGALAEVRAAALELGRGGQAARPEPVAVHWEAGGDFHELPVALDEDGEPVADLETLPADWTLALYGEADYVGLQVLARRSGQRRGRYLDTLALVRSLVHAPLPGFELEAVAAYADGAEHHDGSLTGRERVAAIRRVLDWLDRAGGTGS